MTRLLLLLLLLLYSCGPTVSTEYRSAKTYVSSQNDYQKAINTAMDGIAANPNDALLAYFLATNIYSAPNSPMKNYSKAAKYFELAIQMDNRTEEDQILAQSETIINQDGKQVKIKTVREAVAHYRYVIWVELYNSSVAYLNTGDQQKAIANLEEAMLIDPTNALTYNFLSRIFFEAGSFDQAIKNADKALKIDDTISDLLILKGQIAQEQGNKENAEIFYEKAYKTAKINKESEEKITSFQAALFDVYYTNESYAKAIKINKELINNNPENVTLWSNSGALYQNMLLEEEAYASELFLKINDLPREDLELLIFIYEDCINYAEQARTQFIMCNQLELNEDEAKNYLNEAQELKQRRNDLRSQIRKIEKRIKEMESE